MQINTEFIILSTTLLVALLALLSIIIVLYNQLNQSKKQLSTLNQNKIDLVKEIASTSAKYNASLEENKSLKCECSKLQESKSQAQINLSAYQEKVATLNERLENKAKEDEVLQKKLQADFENLSNKIFEATKEKMSNANLEQIGNILSPLKSNIKEFKEKVEKLSNSNERSSESMKIHIENLMKMNTQLGEEAKNLASALRTKNKTAGNWGESVLQLIFESCGFIEGVHFNSQKSYTDKFGEQKRLVPDFIVYLPENRSIIVDSKLSLLDFIDYNSAEDANTKRTYLTKFKKSVREHLKDFSKKYNDLPDINCSFKLMFMPVEPAYNLIVEEDKELLTEAYSSNVLIVGPTSVMAVLKFAQITYRNYSFAKNMQEICRIGALIQERVEKFAKRFEKLGEKIVSLQKDYDETKTSLTDGNQSLLLTTNRFIEKSKKIEDYEQSQ